MITIFLGTNPTPVARKWKAKDIQSLSNQSECAFNAIHCFRYILNWPIHLVPVVVNWIIKYGFEIFS